VKRKAFVIAGAVVILVVATVLAITLSLSSSGPNSDGPFGPSGQTNLAENCDEITGHVLTYAFEDVKNSGSSDATIQRISYVSPRNLQVLQAFTIPFNKQTNRASVMHPGGPPQWMLADRTSVIRPGHQYLLVLVTRLIGQEGRADAVLVNYTENGAQYVLRTTTSLDVKHQPLQC